MDDVVSLSLAIDPVNLYVITKPKIMSSYEELAWLTGGKVFNVDDTTELLLSTLTILNRPAVQLPLAEYIGLVGDEFNFIATATDVSGGSSGLRYDWDLNGDGDFEFQDVGAQIEHRYTAEFHGTIQVKVTDQQGLSSTMSAKVDVYHQLPSEATIEYLSATPIIGGEATVNYLTAAQRILVLLDDLPIGYLEAESRSFTLTDLAQESVKLTLVPYNEVGWMGQATEVLLTPGVPLAPNTGVKE